MMLILVNSYKLNKLSFLYPIFFFLLYLKISTLILYLGRFYLSGAEVIAAAEQQLETAGGVEDTPFVTITVTIDAADSAKRIVSAYQVKGGLHLIFLCFDLSSFSFNGGKCFQYVLYISN